MTGIKLLITDLDGILTDNTFIEPQADDDNTYCGHRYRGIQYDGIRAIQNFLHNDIPVVVISYSKLKSKVLKELTDCHYDCKNKFLCFVNKVAPKYKLNPNEEGVFEGVIFVTDNWDDWPLLQVVEYPFVPENTLRIFRLVFNRTEIRGQILEEALHVAGDLFSPNKLLNVFFYLVRNHKELNIQKMNLM
jgi:3-deoxy-D-manno-octulosonate 8-phosphate phosphatase KdsC-like HAD superfamily phosphatase